MIASFAVAAPRAQVVDRGVVRGHRTVRVGCGRGLRRAPSGGRGGLLPRHDPGRELQVPRSGKADLQRLHVTADEDEHLVVRRDVPVVHLVSVGRGSGDDLVPLVPSGRSSGRSRGRGLAQHVVEKLVHTLVSDLARERTRVGDDPRMNRGSGARRGDRIGLKEGRVRGIVHVSVRDLIVVPDDRRAVDRLLLNLYPEVDAKSRYGHFLLPPYGLLANHSKSAKYVLSIHPRPLSTSAW